MYVYPPVAVNAAGGTQPPNPLTGGQILTGPFVFGAKLYVALQSFSPGTCKIYRSTDNGITWSEVGIGGSAAGATFSAWYGGTFIRTAYCGNTITVVPIHVQDFDLTTETWGASSAAGPNAKGILACPIMADGNTLVFFNDDATGLQSNYKLTIFSGGAFSAATHADANHPAGINHTGSNGFSIALSDGATIAHCFYTWIDAGGHTFPVYQLIAEDGTLGTFNNTFEVGVNPPDMISADSIPVPMIPIVYGSNLIVSYIGHSIIVGTPTTGPTFSNVGNVDPGYPGDINLISEDGAQGVVIGGVLYLVYVSFDEVGNPTNRIRLMQTAAIAAPSTGWSAVTIFDGNDGTQIPPGWFPDNLAGATVTADINGQPSVNFISPAIPPPNDNATWWLESAPPVALKKYIGAGLYSIPLPDPRGKCNA